MFRCAALVFLLALAASAANVKLYLKDGTYQLVREYKVEAERVRYYSVERSDWEEIPLDLVDLKRTQAEIRERDEVRKADAQAVDAEEKAERTARREVDRIPSAPGVYMVEGETLRTFKQAESKVVTNKGRSLLKILSPIPVVAGKATIELDGPKSSNVVANAHPEFYFRLVNQERLAIVKLTGKKESRVVQRWSIIPVTKETIEEQEEVASFKSQIEEGLYKIWSISPLEAGEYAVVEYTEGKGNVQVWDFSCRPAAKGP